MHVGGGEDGRKSVTKGSTVDRVIIHSNLETSQIASLTLAAAQLNVTLEDHADRHSWVRVLGGSDVQTCAVIVGPRDTLAPWKTVDEIRRVDSRLPVFGWLSDNDSDLAMNALRTGVSGLLHSDCSPEFLVKKLTKLSSGSMAAVEGLCAHSARGRVLAAAIQALGESRADVLLTGPSGSGKEICARLIHQLSARKQGPFVVMNCAAIPHDLMESELFGHAKGAFTGAAGESKGLFREAQGGTLLIDEISALSPSAQAKLLRVLQEREVRPVGSLETLALDIRVIATTNKDLLMLSQNAEFREDLYYRLAASGADVPPLNHRRADIPALTRRLLEEYAAEKGVAPLTLTRDAFCTLSGAHWPGNIRQIKAVLLSAVALTDQPIISNEQIQDLLGSHYRKVDLAIFHILQSSHEFVLRYLHKVIDISKGNYRDAAKLADIHISSLYRLVPPKDQRHATSETTSTV